MMKFRHRKIALIAAVVGVINFAPTQLLVTYAAVIAKHISSSQNVSTGSVLVFATNTQSFTNTGVALSTSVSNGTAKTFFVNNGGNETLTRFTMTVTLPTSANITSFRRCNLNVAFTGTNVCASGTSTSITLTAGAATAYVLSLPAYSFYSFQIVQNKTGTMGVSTTANSSNIVSGITNS